jgi:anti-anti-sigma factor
MKQNSAPSATALALSGELIWETEHDFVDKIHHITALDPRPMLIDLSQVTFIDSAGLGSLISVIEHCEKKNIKAAVFRVNPGIEPLISAFLPEKYIIRDNKTPSKPVRSSQSNAEQTAVRARPSISLNCA